MRRTFFALTAICLAPTAVMASVAGGELVGDSGLGATKAVIQIGEIAPSGGVAVGQQGRLGGYVTLAKGDMAGDGPGAGGQRGKKKGGHKGKQKEGKDNPDKKKDLR